MNTDFHTFLDKKGREARKHLEIVKAILEKGGLQVQDFLNEEDGPFLYIAAPEKGLSFGGVRIYKIGEAIAYRIQKQAKTYPYGTAYALAIPEMYNDLVSDDHKEEAAGKKVIESVVREIKKFFEVSKKAEQELRRRELTGDGDPLNQVLITTQGTDYSHLMTTSQ